MGEYNYIGFRCTILYNTSSVYCIVCLFTTPSHVSLHHHLPSLYPLLPPPPPSPLVITKLLSVSMRVYFFPLSKAGDGACTMHLDAKFYLCFASALTTFSPNLPEIVPESYPASPGERKQKIKNKKTEKKRIFAILYMVSCFLILSNLILIATFDSTFTPVD